jgi:hypothetical protein
MASTAYDKKVRVYALAETSLFFDASDAIARLVLQALRVSPSAQRRVSISRAGAWLEYTDLGQLWNRSAPGALPSKEKALQTAEAILTRLEQSCSNANPAWPQRLRGHSLLPPFNLLRRASLDAVLRPDGSAWDHWLYRATPQLTVDGGAKTRAPVIGALVEVRIGHAELPVSVRSRWTPLAGNYKLVDRSPYRAQEGGDAQAANGLSAQPLLGYMLEGEAVPQFYLAPYYFDVDEHGATASSASPFSLTVDIERTKQDGTRMVVAALARGGSGDYIYNWAVHSLARYEEGLRELGRGRQHPIGGSGGRTRAASIELENGAYIVLVNVKDRATGAFKHQGAQIYSSTLPNLSDGEQSGQTA